MKMLWKYKIERIRNKVRVKRYTDGLVTTIIDEDWMTIDEWVIQTKCGYRVAYDMWQLKSKEAVTMFVLRWGAG